MEAVEAVEAVEAAEAEAAAEAVGGEGAGGLVGGWVGGFGGGGVVVAGAGGGAGAVTADDEEAASSHEAEASLSHAEAAAPVERTACLPKHSAPAERSIGLRSQRPTRCPRVPPPLQRLSTVAPSP